jgi:hypothetical protein
MEYPKIDTLFERNADTFMVDPTRLRQPVLGTIAQWDATEKIDGTNIRVMLSASGEVTFGGRTDNANLHSELVQYLIRTFTPEKMAAAFHCGESHDVVLYGEGYGTAKTNHSSCSTCWSAINGGSIRQTSSRSPRTSA